MLQAQIGASSNTFFFMLKNIFLKMQKKSKNDLKMQKNAKMQKMQKMKIPFRFLLNFFLE